MAIFQEKQRTLRTGIFQKTRLKLKVSSIFYLFRDYSYPLAISWLFLIDAKITKTTAAVRLLKEFKVDLDRTLSLKLGESNMGRLIFFG